MRFPLSTFASGELSPQIDSRSDVDKYRAGCRTLENMIPRIYGPATRRPGTKYIDTCNGVSRIIPFVYSNDIAYVVLLENQKMYFYYDGGRVLDSNGRRLYIDTPYLAAHLFELQYKQSNDVMWIVHESYAPRKLTRTSANSFSLDTIAFNNGPFKKRNDLLEDDDITLTPSVITGDGTLTASSATFDSGHVDALFSITQPRVNTTISGKRQSVGVLGGTSILTEGPCTLNISDGWAGTIELQRSVDDGVTWEVRRSFYSDDGKRAVQYTFNEEEDDVLHRVNVTVYESTYDVVLSIMDEDGYVGEETVHKTSKISGDLTVDSSTQTGRCRVTGFVSDTVVNMTVLKDFASTNADTRWAEGSWSTYRGYPGTITFFEERTAYARTTHQPQTVWFSATDDYENFDAGTNDDESFSLTLSSETRNAIQWIAALDALLIGTSGGEWRIRSSADDEALTPTNFSIKQQTSYGSMGLQAQQVGDAVLFADFVGRRVRELTYSGDRYKYTAQDLTSLAEHITESGIVDMAYQRNPDPILWSFRDDGVLLSMTYERDQNVVAWSRHPFTTTTQTTESTETTTYSYPLRNSNACTRPDTVADLLDTSLSGATRVTNQTELAAIAGSGHYTIANDIDISGGWTPLTGFTGILEGNDCTINNLSDSLFGELGTDAEIRNLVLSNVNMTKTYQAGALASTAGAARLIRNVVVNGVTILCDQPVNPLANGGSLGGMAGYAVGDVLFVDCEVNDVSISSIQVINDAAGNIDYTDIGGFIGYVATANFLRCNVNNVTITHAYNDTGGFVGESPSGATFQECSTTGVNISCDSVQNNEICEDIGGFAGLNSHNLLNCTASGVITLSPGKYVRQVGGMFGRGNAPYFQYCTCDVDITVTVDGVTNYAEGIGGAVGEIDGSGGQLYCSTSSGNLTVNNTGGATVGSIGGFLGESDSSNSISRSNSDVDISIGNPENDYTTAPGIGGFIGNLDAIGSIISIGSIEYCYAHGDVTTPQETSKYFGGFLGYAEVTSARVIAQTYSTGLVTSGTNSGGYLGYTETPSGLVYTSCYWDTQTSGQSTSAAGEGLTTSQLQDQDYLSNDGWNFTTYWQISSSTVTTTTTYDVGVNSVAVIPGSSEDEIWLIVARYINGSMVRYLEQMQPRNWGDDDNDQWFVDSGLSLEGADADGIVGGLGHLEGEEVAMLVDGAIKARKTVTDGSINVGSAIESKAVIGLPFRYILKPMRMDITSGYSTTQTAIKNIAEIIVSFYESGMVEYGVDTDNLFKVSWRTTEDYNVPPALKTGDVLLNPEGGFSAEDVFILTGNSPINCTVRAIVPRITVTGR